MKQQSKQWIAPGEIAPNKTMTVPSAGKVMATVFWDAQGIILTDYLQKGQTITGKYFATLLIRLHGKLRMERPKLAHKKILFHQDTVPDDTSAD